MNKAQIAELLESITYYARHNALHTEGIGARKIDTEEGWQMEFASAETIVDCVLSDARELDRYGLTKVPSANDFKKINAAVRAYYMVDK